MRSSLRHEIEVTGLDLAPCRHALIVAPHPDDEVLGAGGLVQMLLDAGAAVEVVAVTDGEASHPDSPTMRPEQLVRQRAEEVAAAYHILGLPDGCRHRLGLPDSAVDDQERELTAELERMMADRPPAGLWCIGPRQHDDHPDHRRRPRRPRGHSRLRRAAAALPGAGTGGRRPRGRPADLVCGAPVAAERRTAAPQARCGRLFHQSGGAALRAPR